MGLTLEQIIVGSAIALLKSYVALKYENAYYIALKLTLSKNTRILIATLQDYCKKMKQISVGHARILAKSC